MREGDHSEHAWRRDQCVDHELPAISSASMFAWQREALPAQNLPGHAMSVVLVIIAALQSVLTSGIVFGWAPLQLMLEEEGIYGDVCPDGPPCEEQAVKLDFMYTVATSTFCFCVWPTGLVSRPIRYTNARTHARATHTHFHYSWMISYAQHPSSQAQRRVGDGGGTWAAVVPTSWWWNSDRVDWRRSCCIAG